MACSCSCSPLISNNIARYRALGGAILGCCGDRNHTSGFHCAACNIGSRDYSIVRSSGIANSSWACAGDFGMNLSWSRKWLAWLVGEVKAGRLPEIVEIIGSLDGRTALYWARWNGWAARVYTGGGHIGWAHVSCDRAAAGRDVNLFVGWPQTGGVPIPTPGPVVTTWRETLLRDLPVMGQGWNARPVKKVQALINHHLGHFLDEDGDFGAGTRAGVARFQRVKGLGVDGVVGYNTWKAATVGMPTLKPGASGLPVGVLQSLLNLWGLGLREDRDFGAATTRALQRLQRDAGLAGGADGVAGQASWTFLLTQ